MYLVWNTEEIIMSNRSLIVKNKFSSMYVYKLSLVPKKRNKIQLTNSEILEQSSSFKSTYKVQESSRMLHKSLIFIAVCVQSLCWPSGLNRNASIPTRYIDINWTTQTARLIGQKRLIRAGSNCRNSFCDF